MRLPRVTTPPRGATASPNIVTSSDPPRTGRWLWKRRSSPCVAVATGVFTGPNCDTEIIALNRFLCHIAGLISSGRGGVLMYTQGLDSLGKECVHTSANSTCGGDSGAGYIRLATGKPPTIVGIHSSVVGDETCAPGKVGVFVGGLVCPLK